jgi:hypothetical protein
MKKEANQLEMQMAKDKATAEKKKEEDRARKSATFTDGLTKNLLELMDKEKNKKREGLNFVDSKSWEGIKQQRDMEFEARKTKDDTDLTLQKQTLQELIKLNFNVLGLNLESPEI